MKPGRLLQDDYMTCIATQDMNTHMCIHVCSMIEGCMLPAYLREDVCMRPQASSEEGRAVLMRPHVHNVLLCRPSRAHTAAPVAAQERNPRGEADAEPCRIHAVWRRPFPG